MAMAMVQAFKTFTPPVHILATDLDTNVLAKAQLGIYSLDKLEKIPKEKLKQFFLKGKGAHAGSARVRPELRNMITFRQLNLLDESWPIRGPFDAIFCRNVMIYFDKQTQYKILKKFVPLLAPDGLLFAGHSESFQHAVDLFKLREKTVYELANKPRGSYDRDH
jgi:chemotaxis protein methyltransferase CheR